MSLIETLKLSWRTKSVIAETERTKNLSALVQFLLAHSEAGSKVEKQSLARNVNNYNYEALLFATALAMAKSPNALKPIKRLIAHSLSPYVAQAWPIPWTKLPAEQIRCLCEYVSEFESQLVEDLFRSVPVDLFISAIEGAALAKQINRHLLQASTEVARKLWKRGEKDVALDLLTALVLADPQASAPSWLTEIAAQLPLLSGLAKIRAANLLRKFPDQMWVTPLKETWIGLERQLIAKHEQLTEDAGGSAICAALEQNKILEYSAASVAVALGVAAACDRNYVDLQDNNADSKGLDSLIDRRNALVDNHRELVGEYHLPLTFPARREVIEANIRKLQDQIKEMDAQIEQKRKGAMMQMSPGRLLALVLRDEQSFQAPVRQAAAWALYKLIDLGNLNDSSRQKLQILIRQSIFDRDQSKLLDQIRDMNLEEEVTSSALNAVQEHLESGNWPRLIARIVALELEDNVREQVLTLIRNFDNGVFPSHHFRERVVQFSSGQRLLEFEQSILDALAWMLDMVAWQEIGDGNSCDWNCGEVREIVRLIWERIPNVVEFLSKYPLRLMTSKQHAVVLGQFARTKAGISQWTRYTPPLWRREMPQDKVGKVQKRYHELDDRSAPNAMGISWRLFQHRVLALPVIYHEFMHYGGPNGNPVHGISNECEVHLREIVFTRQLIAQMAPEWDEEIPQYESQMASLLRSSGQTESLIRLLMDLRQDRSFQFLNAQIAGAYGEAMSADEARTEIARIMNYENQSIWLLNDTDEMKLAWQPEVEWPLLNTPQTRALSERFYRVLYRSLTTSQRMSEETRDAVLSEQALIHCQEEWAAYTRRDHALSGFLNEVGFMA